ncbi:MAG: hypothetical protein KC636_39235, partial [Myxococcales bacterium]|nr:hypothetical protein [Myxococcales bacterium]
MTPPLDPRARLSARVVISLLLLAACTPETTVAGDADAGAMPPPANAARDGDEAPAPAPAVIADDPDAPRYLEPSPDIVKVVDAPPTPLVAVDPTGRRLLQITRASLPGIDVVAEPFLRLGGVRIGPRRNERRRTEYFTGLSIKRLADAVEVPVNLPEGSLLGYPSWSFDGAHVAVTRAVDDGLELWIIDAETGAARQLLDAKVTDVVGAAFTWLPGSRSLLVRLVPDPSARPPEAPRVPSGPVVQDTVGRAAKNRTYQDLLANAHDSAVFEHFARSQLARVDLKGAVTKLGAPGIYPDVDPSPDGARLLVTEIKRPYSYVVPYYWFTRDITVWGEAGPERTIAALPASEEVPIQGVPEGPREVTWQPHRASALVWAEALDGGDPERDVPQRDKLMRLDLAADGAPVELLRTDERLYDVTFTDVAELALVSEYDRDRRWLKTMIHTLDRPERPPEVLIDRSVHDRYGDPGWP